MSELNTVFKSTFDKLLGMGFDEIIQSGGELYLVGGFVRDSIRGEKSKDIDVVVTGLDMKVICEILAKHGKVDVVGKSFAVLKFTKACETIDVAVPRKDTHVDGGGHKDVVVDTENVTIYDDLKRRDFTMNAISVHHDGTMYDPFSGMRDIESGKIRCVDTDVFAMDPLRMLRAVVFAARFGFELDATTFELIRTHGEWIKRIPGERFESELRKVWFVNGSVKLLMKHLLNTGLYHNMFDAKESFAVSDFDVRNLRYSDFFYCVLSHCVQPALTYKNVLKGDSLIVTEIDKINYLVNYMQGKTPDKQRIMMYLALSESPGIIHSIVLFTYYANVVLDFTKCRYPKDRKSLAINGNDLIDLNVPQMDRNAIMFKLAELVLSDVIHNHYNDLSSKVRELIKNK